MGLLYVEICRDFSHRYVPLTKKYGHLLQSRWLEEEMPETDGLGFGDRDGRVDQCVDRMGGLVPVVEIGDPVA